MRYKFTKEYWNRFTIRQKDIRKATWFAFDNSIFYDSRFYDFTPSEFKAFIYMMCEASRQLNNGAFELNAEHFIRNCRVSDRCTDRGVHIVSDRECLDVLDRCYKKLKKLQVLEQVRGRGQYAGRPLELELEEEGEEEEELEKKEQAPGRAKALPPLASFWNENCGNLPKVKACGKDRTRKAELRLKEKPDLQYWAQVISILKASDFCNGKNERGWRADFDFLLREETANKALEGKYENRKQDNRSANTPGFALKALLKKD